MEEMQSVVLEQPPVTHNQKEYTVSEISGALKRTVEDNFSWVRVRGEISGLKRAGSGHIYFNLKDADCVLAAVCWKGVAQRLTFLLEDGLEAICTGKVTTYGGQSKYQITVNIIEPAGEGALMALLEKRKKELAAEGLFDEGRKKELPLLPKVIGVVTSPTGAVIRDILHRIADRFPVHVIVWPVLVQGNGAKEQIAAAIEGFNALPEGGDIPRPDLLIVARGGGSLEDLWAFNEEIVVRAAANSAIPLISAVGHETDTTLIDYASDKRAPTPTAAAEMAVPVREEWLAGVMDYRPRMHAAITRNLKERQQYILALSRGLVSPGQMLGNMAQRLDDWSERLRDCLPRALEQKAQSLTAAAGRLQPGPLFQRIMLDEQRISAFSRLLESYHYKKVLARGFALVRREGNLLVTSAAAVTPGMALEIEFADGTQAVVAGEAPPETEKKFWRKPKKDDRQDSLF